jgi:hypothetical protein
MDRVEVEVFSQATNAWVIRTPGRQFPAAVVQGDTLSSLYALAESVLGRARACRCEDEELAGEAEELRDRLWDRVQHLEQTLQTHGIALPYERTLWPK